MNKKIRQLVAEHKKAYRFVNSKTFQYCKNKDNIEVQNIRFSHITSNITFLKSFIIQDLNSEIKRLEELRRFFQDTYIESVIKRDIEFTELNIKGGFLNFKRFDNHRYFKL